MAYVPGANYSYSITPTSGGGTPINYSAPLVGGKSRISDTATPEQIAAAGNDVYVPLAKRRSSYGNVFQSANANPMDYSLYSNYYATTPSKSLAGALQSEYDAMLARKPPGYSGNLAMQGGAAPAQLPSAIGGYATSQTPEQFWAATNLPGTPSLAEWNAMTQEQRNAFIARQRGWI